MAALINQLALLRVGLRPLRSGLGSSTFQKPFRARVRKRLTQRRAERAVSAFHKDVVSEREEGLAQSSHFAGLNRQSAPVAAAPADGSLARPNLRPVRTVRSRRIHVDRESISEAARAFGFSRPSFYQAQSAFQQDGVFGLFPHKRGPQGGHKLTSEVMDFILQQRSEDSALTPEQLAQAVQRRFRVQVHPRSIQRRLLAEKKRR